MGDEKATSLRGTAFDIAVLGAERVEAAKYLEMAERMFVDSAKAIEVARDRLGHAREKLADIDARLLALGRELPA